MNLKIANSLEELLMKCQKLSIEVKESNIEPNLLNLTYSQIESPKFDEFVKMCRGLVVDKNTLEIVCYPFTRFFNYGEGFVDQNELKKYKETLTELKFYEKVDGSLIKIYWYQPLQKWLIGTKGQAIAESKVFSLENSTGKSFCDLVYEALDFKNDEEFQHWCNHVEYLIRGNTYLFELTSKYNAVVVPHEETKLWFLGTVKNETGKVIRNPEHENFDEENKHSQLILKPKKYDFNNLDEAINFAKTLPFNDEGYVIYNGKEPVFKIKSPAYVQVHLMSDKNVLFGEKPVIRLVYLGEVAEYLVYFPEHAKKMMVYQEAKDKMIEDVVKEYQKVKLYLHEQHLDNKGYAEYIKSNFFKHALFYLKHQDEQRLNKEEDLDVKHEVEKYFSTIVTEKSKIKYLMDYMDLNDIHRPLKL